MLRSLTNMYIDIVAWQEIPPMFLSFFSPSAVGLLTVRFFLTYSLLVLFYFGLQLASVFPLSFFFLLSWRPIYCCLVLFWQHWLLRYILVPLHYFLSIILINIMNFCYNSCISLAFLRINISSCQKVSSSNFSTRRITLGLCSLTKSSVVLSAPAVARRSETIRLEASFAIGRQLESVLYMQRENEKGRYLVSS